MNAQKMDPPLVVGLGEVLWDLLPSGRQLGGAPANVACHARAFGAEAVVVSAVGEDEPGRDIIHSLQERGLSTEYVAVLPDHPTSTVTVELGDEGAPRYVIHEDVAWDYLPWTGALAGLAARCDAVCFGSLAQRSATTRETMLNFLGAAGDPCLRVFDVNLRQSYYGPDLIRDSLEQAEVLKVNDDEFPILAGYFGLSGSEAEQVSALAERFGLALVALTRGGKGSTLYADGRISDRSGGAPVIGDTVGAGDSFTAAMIAGRLAGRDLDALHDHARRVAAYVCSQAGATPALPQEMVACSGGL